MSGELPEWRVTFWFLGDYGWGWTQVSFAFVKSKTKECALALGVQRAVKLGFAVHADTHIDVQPEKGDGLL